MLTLTCVYDANDLNDLYCKLAVDEKPTGAHFVFLDEGKPVGFMRVKVEDCAIVDKVFFLEGVPTDDKRFFVHAMFFKFSLGAPIVIKFPGKRTELERFGFEYDGEYMTILSSDINLHGGCNGNRQRN